jgi:DNA-binding MarR family transcriptional regulator
VPDPADARAKIVRLSPKGRKAVAIAQHAFDDYERTWIKHLGARDTAILGRILRKLNTALEPEWSQHAVRIYLQSRDRA